MADAKHTFANVALGTRAGKVRPRSAPLIAPDRRT
jgi:hypothetical protein